ncbi:MAG: hypothetical protein KJ063_24890 [Anaerolineae bacterium]|nr:hypothetical protein [Anaerolineae bacterium]
MENIISRMGSSFLVSAFVPALAFVTFGMVLFTPIIPSAILEQIKTTFLPIEEPAGIVLLLFTVVLGFVLFSLNTYIYKLYEGYFILELIPWLTKFQRQKFQRKYITIKILERLVNERSLVQHNALLREQLIELHFQQRARFYLEYPPDEHLILPTRFGNLFRSIEAYSVMRYKMDAVLLWPRLIHVMPPSYYQKLSQSNNKVAFLVNCSVLSLLMVIAFTLAAVFQLAQAKLAEQGIPQLLVAVPIYDSSTEIYRENAFLCLIGIILAMTFFVIFYRASLPVVNQYGNLIRGAYDLFRFHLMEELRLKRPEMYLDELTMWRNLSHFVGYGEFVQKSGSLFNYEAQSTRGEPGE